jgi:hypothetical protein
MAARFDILEMDYLMTLEWKSITPATKFIPVTPKPDTGGAKPIPNNPPKK